MIIDRSVETAAFTGNNQSEERGCDAIRPEGFGPGAGQFAFLFFERQRFQRNFPIIVSALVCLSVSTCLMDASAYVRTVTAVSITFIVVDCIFFFGLICFCFCFFRSEFVTFEELVVDAVELRSQLIWNRK